MQFSKKSFIFVMLKWKLSKQFKKEPATAPMDWERSQKSQIIGYLKHIQGDYTDKMFENPPIKSTLKTE